MPSINDVQIERLVLYNPDTDIGIDLTPIFTKLNIYENIFTNYITGNIQILDGLSLLEKFPLRGDEKILVSFKGSTLDDMTLFTKVFDVYKLSEVDEIVGKRARMYTLQFATIIAGRSRQNKLRLGFNDTESNIVKKIVEINLKLTDIEVEESKNKSKIIIPGWSPLQTINHLTKYAQHIGDLESASFLFYEDKDKFNFKSVEYLLKQEPTSRFNQNMPGKIDDIDFFSFKNLSIENCYDNIEQSINGAFGSTAYDVDLINKTVTKNEKTFDDMFSSVPKLDPRGAQLKKRDLESAKRTIYHTYTNDDVKDRPHQYSSRDFVLGLLENYMLVGITPGNSNLMLGSVAELDIHSISQLTPDDKDKVFSGNYLITAIRHELTTNEYVNTIEFRKTTLKEES